MSKLEELRNLFVEAVMEKVEFKDFHFNLKEDEDSGVKWLVSDGGSIWFHKTKEEALETEAWLFGMYGEDRDEYTSILIKVPDSMTKEEAENIVQSGEWKKYEELQEADEESLEPASEDKRSTCRLRYRAYKR